MPRTIQKSDLPTKICPVCQRPFAWRKKWAKTWDDVRYCSERCRSEKDASRHAHRAAKQRELAIPKWPDMRYIMLRCGISRVVIVA